MDLYLESNGGLGKAVWETGTTILPSSCYPYVDYKENKGQYS